MNIIEINYSVYLYIAILLYSINFLNSQTFKKDLKYMYKR